MADYIDREKFAKINTYCKRRQDNFIVWRCCRHDLYS